MQKKIQITSSLEETLKKCRFRFKKKIGYPNLNLTVIYVEDISNIIKVLSELRYFCKSVKYLKVL